MAVAVEQGRHGQASYLSKITHQYLQPLVELGYSRPLREADLEDWPLDNQDNPEDHTAVFEAAVVDPVTGEVDVGGAIRQVLGCRYAWVGTWKLVYLVSVLGQPALLYRPSAATPPPSHS